MSLVKSPRESSPDMTLLLAFLFAAQSDNTGLFEKKVRPVFAAKCYGCHGPKMQMGGINLSTAPSIDMTRIARAVTYNEKIKMPPGGKLPAEEMESIKSWVEQGAHWPKAAAQPVAQHWSLQPVKDRAPPAVNNEKWIKGPIDRFILAKLEENKLRPASQAPKETLLRRATYDLTGLPPTPKEIEEFIASQSPDAFKKVVERLLASERYGERWGRHWLDVARYADSTGMDEDHIYPHAWRYRDYVVKSFNMDLPYNRFVVEQIAGDLMPGRPERGTIATGFLALGPKPLARQDRVQMIYDVVDEQIDTVSKVFMGLTIGCARCHDHKFDPIPTKDYYGLAGIFASTLNFRNLGRPGSVSYIYYAPLDPAAYGKYQAHRWSMYSKQLEMEEALAEDVARESALLRPKIADSLVEAWKASHGGAPTVWSKWIERADEKARKGYLKNWFEATEANIGDVAKQYQEAFRKSGEAWETQLSNWRRRLASDIVADRDLQARPTVDAGRHALFAAVSAKGGPADFAESQRVAFLRQEFQDLKKTLPAEPAMASAVTDGVPVEQRVFLRGDHQNLGEPTSKHFPTALGGGDQPAIKSGSGRLEFAQWLTNPAHPLTARVMVNRIWQWHFGEALVRTPNNWGTTGEQPTHPELLDYLAKQFVERGWSIKEMHRMIMLSSTYRQSSNASREQDPGNRLWARANRVRMSVEEVRDSYLMLDGSLDPTIGGSLLSEAKGKKARSDPDDNLRRTLYTPVRRGSVPKLLAAFDFGDATSPSEGRPRSNVAPQALYILNSKFVLDRAQGFAKLLLADTGANDRARLELAYLAAFGRRPGSGEIDSALSYIDSMEKRLGTSDAHLTAWQSFCHILMSANEFLYVN
jgi:Protein of unknown function (DUF1549)/Protein of unknown function (DUF1553)